MEYEVGGRNGNLVTHSHSEFRPPTKDLKQQLTIQLNPEAEET